MTPKELAAKRMREAIEIGVDRAIAELVTYAPNEARAVRERRDDIAYAVSLQLARDFKVIERARGERTAT